MKPIQSPLGISRTEYIAGVRLRPQHPAFAGTYEDWIEANTEIIRKIAANHTFVAPATRVTSKR